MRLQLYFLRHGKAGNRQDWHGEDTKRPLTSEGKKRMKREAATIWRLRLPVDVIISSPLDRDRQTAEIVAKARGSAARLVTDATRTSWRHASALCSGGQMEWTAGIQRRSITPIRSWASISSQRQ